MPEDRLPKLLVLVIFMFIHAFFTAAQAALSALPEARLRRQAEDEGDRKAQRLLALAQAPERCLAAIQLILTLALLLCAAFAADSFAGPLAAWIRERWERGVLSDRALNDLAVVVVTLALSFFSLVLGILAPRRLGTLRAEQVARFTVGPVCAAAAVCRPFSWLLSKATNGVVRLMGIDPNDTGEDLSEDEIRMMVDLGEEQGAIESAEKELIENIFEFNNTTAEDVMIHRTDIEMLWVEDTAETVLDAIRTTGLSRFPVYDEDADDIIGILNTREYLLNAQKTAPLPLRELLRPAYFVPETVRTDVLFRDMQNKKVHIAIVVDEYGGTSGLVTMEDLLEEIVGNIYDEFDPQEAQEIVPLGDSLWRVAGSAELEAVADALEVKLPEDEEYDTLGGLVFSRLSVIPEDGSQFEVDALGLHIKVEDFTDRRVEWALVSKLAPEEGVSAEEG